MPRAICPHLSVAEHSTLKVAGVYGVGGHEQFVAVGVGIPQVRNASTLIGPTSLWRRMERDLRPCSTLWVGTSIADPTHRFRSRGEA